MAVATAGNPIRKKRKQLGLTQEELATNAGVARRTIIYLEKGDKKPQQTTAIMLAAALHCKPAELEVKS